MLLRLLQEDMFSNRPDGYLLCYKCYQPLYDKFAAILGDKLEFCEGMPSYEDIERLTSTNKHTVLMLDDLSHEWNNSELGLQTITAYSHHKNMSVICIQHSVFMRGCRHAREISLNQHFIIFTRSPRDGYQLKYLGQQIFPGKSLMIADAYEEIVANSLDRYPYMVLNLSPAEKPIHCIMSHIFPSDPEMFVYVEKKKH